MVRERVKTVGAVAGGEGDRDAGTGLRVTPEERDRMIAEAAYYRAERRGFATGGELEDWLRAETEIDRLIEGSASRARRATRVA